TPDAFDPFGTSGKAAPISTSDITALDVIGWDAGASSPPPLLPDLTAGSLVLNSTGSNVTFQINNIGSGNSGSSTAGIYLSTDSTITTSDSLLATASTSALSANTSIINSGITITLPSNLAAGTYYLGVVADSGNAVAEGNES